MGRGRRGALKRRPNQGISGVRSVPRSGSISACEYGQRVTPTSTLVSPCCANYPATSRPIPTNRWRSEFEPTTPGSPRTTGKSSASYSFNRGTSSAQITFLAVLPEMHRRGIGEAITSKAIEHARSLGLRAIEVKTLDESSGYEPYMYIGTRAFWESMGFVQIDCIDPLPGWQPGNPSAIYVLPLA